MKIPCTFVPNFILDIGNRSSNIEQSFGFQGYGESFDGYFYILLNIPSHFSHCYYRSRAGSDCQHFPDEASHNEMRRFRARPLTLMCCSSPPEGGGHCYFYIFPECYSLSNCFVCLKVVFVYALMNYISL